MGSSPGYGSNITHYIIHICFILTISVRFTNGYCSALYVNDAEYDSVIDGTYYIYGYNCNGQPVWTQTYQADGVYVTGFNYIAFGYNSSYLISGSNIFSAWVIGPTSCPGGSFGAALAINQQSVNTLPYNLGNTWYEKNSSNQFVPSSSLYVSCSDGLNGWEIFGIVIGSICGLLLLISLLACCCSKHKQNKRRTNPTAVVYATNGTRGTCTVVTTSTSGVQPMPGTLYPDPVYVINPPAYDNNGYLPPAYEAINPVPTSLPPVNELPTKERY